MTGVPRLKNQEIPLDHPDSSNMFQPGPDKPLLATPGVIEMYGHEVIMACIRILRQKADEHDGIDYLQVFEADESENLWFIEDGPDAQSNSVETEDGS